jgi:hypothetical protein
MSEPLTSISLPEAVAILFKQTEEIYATVSIVKDNAPYFHEMHEQDENERIAVSLAINLTDNITRLMKKADSLMNLTFTVPPEKENATNVQSNLPEGTSEPNHAS